MMQKAHQSSVVSGQLIQGPKSGRKALQPKNNNNSPAPITPNSTTNSKPKPKEIENIILPSPIDNKENIPPNGYYSTPVNVQLVNTSPIIIESLQEDASLADELSAIREKLDRLRVDKDKTEKMLKERAVMLDLKIKEIIQRGDVQKQLEIEVDRLYRLNEIRLSCLRISPIRTLRDKEQEKKIKQDQLKANIKTQETREYYDEHKVESPKSEEASTEN